MVPVTPSFLASASCLRARLDLFGFTALFIERRSGIQGRIRDGESPGSGNCR